MSDGKMSDKIGSTVLFSKGGTSLSNLLDSDDIKSKECSSVKRDEEHSRASGKTTNTNQFIICLDRCNLPLRKIVAP